MKHVFKKKYFEKSTPNDKLAFVCEKYYLPIIQRFIMINRMTNVLDIGCGGGGALLPFAKMGCKITGIDKSAACIKSSSAYLKKRNVSANLIVEDIFKINDWECSFDVIFVQNVMEYICDKKQLLERIKHFLKPNGVVFIGFNMWYAPFGGFRSLYHNKIISKIPFIHLLPSKVFNRMLLSCHEDLNTISQLAKLRNCKVSIEWFRHLVSECDYNIFVEQLLSMNPYANILKEPTPKQVFPFIKRLPHIRNYFSTSCLYVLKKNSYHVQIITKIPENKSQESDS